MKKIKRIVPIVFVILCVISMSTTQVYALTESDLWGNADWSDFGVEDCTNNNGKFVGQVHYEWMVEYIENDVSNYDFYAVYLIETITPSKAYGGKGRILDGYALFNMRSSDMIVADALPERSAGSYSYGVSAQISSDGVAQFQSSISVSLPEVDINPVTDANWGGYHRCSFDMNGDARIEQNKIRNTLIIRVTEGSALSIDITMYLYWAYGFWWTHSSDTITFRVTCDGTPGGGGGGGGHDVM